MDVSLCHCLRSSQDPLTHRLYRMSQDVMAPRPEKHQSAAALTDQQQQAAFAATYGDSPDDLPPSSDLGGLAASAAQPGPTAASLQHLSRDGAPADSTPRSAPLQDPAAGAQPSTKPGDSSSTSDRTEVVASSNLSGSLKPVVRYKAQKAWRDRQKVSKQCEHACSPGLLWHRAAYHAAGRQRCRSHTFKRECIQQTTLSAVHVALTLQEKAQRTAAQLETLQQEVKQLSVVQVQCRSYDLSHCDAVAYPSHATPALAAPAAQQDVHEEALSPGHQIHAAVCHSRTGRRARLSSDAINTPVHFTHGSRFPTGRAEKAQRGAGACSAAAPGCCRWRSDGRSSCKPAAGCSSRAGVTAARAQVGPMVARHGCPGERAQ